MQPSRTSAEDPPLLPGLVCVRQWPRKDDKKTKGNSDVEAFTRKETWPTTAKIMGANHVSRQSLILARPSQGGRLGNFPSIPLPRLGDDEAITRGRDISLSFSCQKVIRASQES